jgi:hypothetical protein
VGKGHKCHCAKGVAGYSIQSDGSYRH